MKWAWFLMIAGCLMILQGVSIIFVGFYPPNFWILLCGICFVAGLGCYPAYVGYKRRKNILEERQKGERVN